MRSLDILSNIVFILGEDFKPLIANTLFIDTILVSLNDPETDVKQYVSSFLGELVKSCPSAVPHHIDNIIMAL